MLNEPTHLPVWLNRPGVAHNFYCQVGDPHHLFNGTKREYKRILGVMDMKCTFTTYDLYLVLLQLYNKHCFEVKYTGKPTITLGEAFSWERMSPALNFALSEARPFPINHGEFTAHEVFDLLYRLRFGVWPKTAIQDEIEPMKLIPPVRKHDYIQPWNPPTAKIPEPSCAKWDSPSTKNPFKVGDYVICILAPTSQFLTEGALYRVTYVTEEFIGFDGQVEPKSPIQGWHYTRFICAPDQTIQARELAKQRLHGANYSGGPRKLDSSDLEPHTRGLHRIPYHGFEKNLKTVYPEVRGLGAELRFEDEGGKHYDVVPQVPKVNPHREAAPLLAHALAAVDRTRRSDGKPFEYEDPIMQLNRKAKP